MTTVPFRNFGRYGVIADGDTQQQSLPMGSWTDARNVRFSGMSFEKMLEPQLLYSRNEQEEETDPISGILRWCQGWSDGLSTYMVAATDTFLYFWRASSPTDGRWVQAGGPYQVGRWQGFAWGDTVIANNGQGAPQIFNPDKLQFEDLPNWGLISTAADITNNAAPSKDTAARCVCILPLGSFLVALGVSENGLYGPNTSWWSDATSLVGYRTGLGGTGGPPSWDYESPATLSGKREIGVGDGALTWGAGLNENLICYTERSAIAMQPSGGPRVMSTRRLFGKGAAGLHCAAEYNNRHYVVSRDELYIHDGSTVQEIAKDRVQDEFFARLGKTGRYGGFPGGPRFDRIQVVQNPARKEINVVFDSRFFPEQPERLPPYVETVVAELLYEEPLTGETPRYTPEGCLLVAGSQIIANPGEDKVIYSQDLGRSWIQTGILPRKWDDGTTSWRANIFAYHPEGSWYVHMENSQDREYEWYRTKDNGASWTKMNDGGIDNFGSTACIVDKFGRLVTAARGTVEVEPGVFESGMWIQRYNDPHNSIAVSQRFRMRSNAHNVDNLKEVGGGYAVSIWTGTEQDIEWVPYSFDQADEYDDVILEDDYTPWSFAVNDEQVGIAKAKAGSTLEWFVFINDGNTPLQEKLINYPEDMANGRVQGNPEYVAFAAKPTTGDQARWLVYLAEDLLSPIQGPTTVIMPSNVKTDTQQNLYWAGGHDWIGHYLNDDNRTMIVRFNMAGLSVSQREMLVYNYEDDNYTWADASVDKAPLEDVEWMTYDYIPGWQVRWSDLDAAGTTWEDLFQAGTRWSDFYFAGTEQNLLWLTNEGLYQSDVEVKVDGLKLYYVERQGIDLDDLVAQWTTNKFKYISEFYFHAQGYDVPSTVIDNPFSIELGWGKNLMDDPVYNSVETLNLLDTDDNGDVKFDCRTTGRYLAMRMRFNGTYTFKMSGGDAEVKETHGR